jgi:hypothetical protein
VPQVELLGLAQRYAGTATAVCEGGTLGEVLRDLAAQFPSFAARCAAGELLPPGLIVCINERRFSLDPAVKLLETDRLLILSADVGG